MKSFTPVRYFKVLKSILVGISLLAVWLYRAQLWNIVTMIGNPLAIADYLREFDTYGLAVLSVLMLAQVFLALIPGNALIAASGYLYGAPVTIGVVAVTTILGSQTAFWLARYYGRPLIDKLAPPKVIDYWDNIARNCGPGFFLLTFLLPIFPSDMMCYVAGLGKISSKEFFAANFAGRLLSAITFTLLGAYSFHPPLWFWTAVVIGLAIVFTCWWAYRRNSALPIDKRLPVEKNATAVF